MMVRNQHQQWLERELSRIRAYASPIQGFDPQARLLADLHIDSLEILELVIAVEKYTHQPLEDKTWMEWYCLQDIFDHLERSMPTQE
ncbi:MAG: acyl carrier protein [Serratia liquefaciens]|nr:acyl carrier protein [Serratia liquefaciens]